MLTYRTGLHFPEYVVNLKPTVSNHLNAGTNFGRISLQPSEAVWNLMRAVERFYDQNVLGVRFFWRIITMSEFENEVKKAEKELEQSLITLDCEEHYSEHQSDEFLGEIKMQAQEYGKKVQDAAGKAYDYAKDNLGQVGDKFKELSSKDPKELIEDAKEFARQKPGQTILISAAIGVVLGLLLRGGRR